MLTAGSTVTGGFYFNRDKLDLVAIGGKEGVLPGGEGQRYLHVPLPAMLLLAPAMGGLFVAFMPFIGFFLVFAHIGRRALLGMRRKESGKHVAREKHDGEEPTNKLDGDVKP